MLMEATRQYVPLYATDAYGTWILLQHGYFLDADGCEKTICFLITTTRQNHIVPYCMICSSLSLESMTSNGTHDANYAYVCFVCFLPHIWLYSLSIHLAVFFYIFGCILLYIWLYPRCLSFDTCI